MHFLLYFVCITFVNEMPLLITAEGEAIHNFYNDGNMEKVTKVPAVEKNATTVAENDVSLFEMEEKYIQGIYGENVELNIFRDGRQDEPTTNPINSTEISDFNSTIDITLSSDVSNPVTTAGMTTSSDSTEITTVMVSTETPISIPDTESTAFTTITGVSVTSVIPESTSSTELTISTNSITTTEEITSSIISDSTTVTDSTTASGTELTTLISNPETTTFIINAIDYDEECKRIFTWSRNVISFTPIFPVPCRYYCRVNGIRLYFPFRNPDFTTCGNEMVCIKGTCAERPNADDAAYCNNLFPGRRMTVIRNFFSCYMKCYDLNTSQTYLTRSQNGSSCRSRLWNFNGICRDGFCVRQ